jgi:ionotropic glutamate receptor
MELPRRRLHAAAAPAGRLFSLLVLCTAVESSAAPVRVGVVLDLTSDVGRKSLTCISMALDDFYLKHSSYATRAELHVRDSRGDLVTAVQASKCPGGCVYAAFDYDFDF